MFTALSFKLFLWFGILLAGSSVYSLFVGERGRVRSGIGLARLVQRGEIRLRCALGDGPRRAPPAHTPRTSTPSVSVVLRAFPCLSFPVCRASLISCLSLCELFCFCLASVLSLVFFSVCPSLCPSLCVCLYVCPCLSTVRPKWLLSPDFLREGAPDIQIFKKSINSEKSNRIVIQNNHDYNYKDD